MALHEGRSVEIVAQITDVTELDSLRWTLKEQQSLHGMVGSSSAMRGVFEIIRQVSSSDYPVLISGESGTGKELAARAIHSESRRSEGPFVPINCGALPEHILESELFGHVRGAFTGAIRDKKGRFELADGGTIFLDEVGELTPAFQVKLLRVLQEMRFERVGGERTISVDVRVISATNRDLRQMVQRREFREDLFYRLCVVPIALPPLRDRRSDITLLVETILERIQQETGRRSLDLSPDATDLLLAYRWPGNVRELINALQFAAVRSQDEVIGSEHLPPEVRQDLSSSLQLQQLSTQGSLPEDPLARRSRKKLSVDLVTSALRQTGGNKVQAAKLLGVGRATLYRFLNDNPLPSEHDEG
jgi:transcriptional regulator with GAF, ATPase, and Fis domain